jgi:hypothetical protein
LGLFSRFGGSGGLALETVEQIGRSGGLFFGLGCFWLGRMDLDNRLDGVFYQFQPFIRLFNKRRSARSA